MPIIRVGGVSMAPALKDGDYVFARRYGRKPPRVGDIVVLRHAGLGTIIKRIARLAPNGVAELAGDHDLSTARAEIGPVEIGPGTLRVLWVVGKNGLSRPPPAQAGTTGS